MLVIIKDETTGRDLTINLSTEQYERAQQDPVYVQELIRSYDEENNSLDRQPAVVDEQTDSQRNTLCEENDVPVESITNEENEENVQSASLFIWSDACILLLLSMYEEKKEDFGNKRHKKIFEEIAKKMNETNPAYTMTGNQCQSKINSLKKTYKKILDHNNISGNDRVTWPYFDRMNEIFGQTGWANPVATASEAGPSDQTPTSLRENAPKRKIDSIFDDYFKTKKKIMAERLEIRKESIKLKREQHKEKMDILKSIYNSLNK